MTKRVFVCSPLRGDEAKNKRAAALYCRWAVSQGVSPYAPHVFCTQFLSDEVVTERIAGMRIGLDFLAVCDEIWVFGDNITAGMASEMSHAKVCNIPCRMISTQAALEILGGSPS